MTSEGSAVVAQERTLEKSSGHILGIRTSVAHQSKDFGTTEMGNNN